MKFEGRRAAPLVAALGLLLAQNIYAAPPSARVVTPRLALDKAAIASQRDTNPALNGSIGEWRPTPPDAALQAAANAARQDSNPVLNGTVSSWTPLGASKSVSISTAWTAYEHCHWRTAFEGFAAHADAGNFQAARMALAMAKHGNALYGQTFEVPETRRLAWLHVVELGPTWRGQDVPAASQTALDHTPAEISQ
ncbi:hypothetical protein [Roseateles cavernae]|uniref:hypothetical protein n=1 Tax=Roseateles cavernae TaxID=3153578 RepID=UPI0032E50BDA